MKKLITALLIASAVILILGAGFYFVLKSQLSTDNINKKILEIAQKSGYKMEFGASNYKIGLFSLTAELENLSVSSKDFHLECKRVSILLNPFKALQKKFELNKVYLDTPILTIYKVEEKDSLTKEKERSEINLTTNLTIKNGEVNYDTLSLKSLNGQLFLKMDNAIEFASKMTFESDIKYVKEMGKVKVSVSGDYKNNLELRTAALETEYLKFNISLKQQNKRFEYRLYGSADSLNFIKNLLFKNDSLSLSGKIDFYAQGEYNSESQIDSQLATLVDSFEIDPSSFALTFKEYNLILENGSFLNKQKNNFVFSSNWLIDSLPLEFIIIADYSLLFKDTFDAKITMKGLHARNIIKNIKDFKYDIDGRFASMSNIRMSFSSLNEMDSVILAGKHKITCGNAFIIKDSTALALKSFELNLDSGAIKGSFNLKGMGIEGDIFFTGNYLKKTINANTLSKIDLAEYDYKYKGKGELNGLLTYNFKDNSYVLKGSGRVEDFMHKSLNDVLDISFAGLLVENGKTVKIQDVSIEGNNVNGTFSNILFEKQGNEEIISGESKFSFINYDSLFVPDKSKQKHEESKPPVIDKKYKGEIKGSFDRMIFKSEDIRNGNLIIKISEGTVFAYPVNAGIMKGKVKGNVEYYSQKNGLINAKVEGNKIDVNEFLTKNKFVPFTIGAKVDLNSDLTFLQHKVKETVKGNIIVEAKDGWIMMPDVISNISKVLKLPLSDTFYFDDMYGEFDVDSQRVKFDDFTMEKNGHSLDYSGRVDFNKNMNLKGKYVIDMRIADTGILEKILRMANYESDSIIVDFDVLGTYSKPKVAITYNSVGEYLNNQANDAINDLIDELNNLFKF